MDEANRTIEYQRDGTKRLKKVYNRPDSLDPGADLLLVEYDYDDAGFQILMKDTFGRPTTYIPDDRGWLQQQTYPDGSWEHFTYFKDRRVATLTDRAGHTTSHAYDAAGRATTRTYADASREEFSYDESGRLTDAVTRDPAGIALTSLAFTHLPTGQVETVTATNFGVTKLFRLHYLDDGRLEWWRDESAMPYETTSYVYHDNGWLYQITDPDTRVFTFEYNADGTLRRKTYGNGMWAEYEYDPDRGWLTALRHRKSENPSGIMATFTYRDAEGNPWYDQVGNRLQADVTGNEHHTYGHDADRLDRLLSVDRPQTSNDESYSYDEMGNRLSSSQYADWVYDPLNDQLDAWDSVSYTSDGNGNRRTKTNAAGTTTYTYDFQNRLARIDVPGGGWATYDYDALGRRVRKNVNGAVTLFWYLDEDVVLETDAAGNEQARYTHGPGIDSPLKITRGGSMCYYHEDALGSIVLMTDNDKKSKKTYSYDAFGNVYGQTGTITDFYQYTGREWDSESGLYYYRARHYDPKVGRFLQVDPLPPRWQEMNPYVYVANNPVYWVDPYGLYNTTLAWVGGISMLVGASLGPTPIGIGLFVAGAGIEIYSWYSIPSTAISLSTQGQATVNEYINQIKRNSGESEGCDEDAGAE